MESTPGERLLPSLLDEIAQSDPHRVLYSVSKTKNPAEGFEDIDAQTFARAVNRASWYIDRKLGRGHGFPTLTYMGPQDLVYGILVLACIKAGYKLLLNSPRNTLEAHLSIFEKTDCATFLSPTDFPLPAVKQILAARPMRHIELPDMRYWLEEVPDEKNYPYMKTFSEAKAEPFIVLHTSGSTGLPKPIIQTHGTISPIDLFMTLSSLGYRPTFPAMCTGKRVYVAFPLFHSAGIIMLLASIYAGFTVVLGPFPPSADVANAVHVHGNVQVSSFAPTTLADLVKEPQHLENLGRLEYIVYGGGPCPKPVGDLVATKTRLLNVVGTTECGLLPCQVCEPEDWDYLSLSPVLGYEYRHHSGDLYEQVIVRNSKFEQYQGIFATFPELTEWGMKDLYSKHPTKEDIWLYKGRSDDIIVFSTGEKLNPLDMESIISSNNAIKGALVTGQGRFQSSLLVEAVNPPANEAKKEVLLEVLWPSIQAANKGSPSHGRIHRNMVIFTTAGKPMLRAGKGTVQRAMTVDMYASEIDALYRANETPVNSNTAVGTDIHQNSQDAVKNVIATFTDIDITALPPTADLFQLGLDSLQVTIITRELNKFISANGQTSFLDTRMVYSSPSISALTEVVSALVERKAPISSSKTEEQKMKRLYEIYAANMPISGREADPKPSDNYVFLLTGSTGSLGSYILDSLHRDSHVHQIYCLNRGPESLKRQQKSQSAKNLRPLPEKVICLDADISKPYFGLSLQAYKKLLSQVTHIIHNAWQVNFNLSIDSFANHIGGVRQFVEFSAHSRFGAQLFLVSSISAVGGRTGGVAEQIFRDWHTPGPLGYGESKFVSELLLDTAAREAEIPTIVCRVGQVSGPTSEGGMWPRQEWLPSLIASSKHLGKIPDSLGQAETVDWIPVDVLGKTIVELATHIPKTREHGATVYHAVNPRRTSWAKLLPTVVRYLSHEKEIETVSLEQWVDALRGSAYSAEDLSQKPAIKLINFFEGLVSWDTPPALLDTENALRVSQTLADLGPVREEWMENWMRQWAF
ncbi:hypothetical protein GGS26DRAFT_539733 [Hypomontagnella submonticulosa]|nr:hypothetical protein GGS26DRAFT_539733 [Hypomontagnella submonticulosa]